MRYTLDANADYLRVVPNSGVVLLGSAGQSLADISGGGVDNYGEPAFSGRPSSERYINPGASPAPLIIDGIKQNYVKADVPSHAGGALAFGPDGYLYVSIGDGTSANYADPRTPDVQNLNSLSGKVLRIDPMTGQGLTDNPFYQPGQSLDSNISKVYQYGFRHPFSMAFDDLGRLFVADVGWSPTRKSIPAIRVRISDGPGMRARKAVRSTRRRATAISPRRRRSTRPLTTARSRS